MHAYLPAGVHICTADVHICTAGVHICTAGEQICTGSRVGTTSILLISPPAKLQFARLRRASAKGSARVTNVGDKIRDGNSGNRSNFGRLRSIRFRGLLLQFRRFPEAFDTTRPNVRGRQAAHPRRASRIPAARSITLS